MAGAHDFSLRGYADLLQLGQRSGYRFVTFGEAAAVPAEGGRHCLLRHDVDVSIDYALEMARVEHTNNVRTTYFVMLRSPAYNLLSRSASLAVREIVSLGHEVGVHFDAQHPLVRPESLSQLVLAEAGIIADLAERPVHAVSFHQPSRFILESAIEVPGLINTYNTAQLAGWHYVSDSNRNWRAETAAELFAAGARDKIQLLVHPMWWVCDAASTEEVWNEAIISNFETMQRQFLETEGAYGPRRRIQVTLAGLPQPEVPTG
jgi:hypothetical protein